MQHTMVLGMKCPQIITFLQAYLAKEMLIYSILNFLSLFTGSCQVVCILGKLFFGAHQCKILSFDGGSNKPPQQEFTTPLCHVCCWKRFRVPACIQSQRNFCQIFIVTWRQFVPNHKRSFVQFLLYMVLVCVQSQRKFFKYIYIVNLSPLKLKLLWNYHHSF